MKDKCTNKESQLRVRLTPHQSFKLDEMCEKLEITKSALIRYILD
nr:MAG TPA: NikA, BACTERIAL CONJUGATION, RELAXASE, DNA [Caudoviricetes sp.]